MKQRFLLLFVMMIFITTINAQKKNEKKVTGYAITSSEKGGRNWKEVRLVDVTTGEVLKTVFSSSGATEPLNAKTGKPVVKKKQEPEIFAKTISRTFTRTPDKKIVNLDQEFSKVSGNGTAWVTSAVVVRYKSENDGTPFSTNSAAMAYDKKHDRLYYTPMGINQLRYIDLKAKSPKVYYFEDENFGQVKGMWDVTNQITRMVIASDGNGYALSNDANHLLRFTTGKRPEIADLGALTDDPANGENSIHSNRMYGGDIVANASENLYLITAYRYVFKISIASKTAKYLGTIKGLPQGFSTNGAMVEEGSKVIVASSQSTAGYYRFDLNTLEAEKIAGGGSVYNVSDLANSNFAFEKKKDEEATEEKEADVTAKQSPVEEAMDSKGIAVYPNPVTNGVVKLSFANQPAGKYQVQLLDLSGRMINSTEVNINAKSQVAELRLPELSVKGSYFIKIFSETNKISATSKIVVQ